VVSTLSARAGAAHATTTAKAQNGAWNSDTGFISLPPIGCDAACAMNTATLVQIPMRLAPCRTRTHSGIATAVALLNPPAGL
jgi:hypothetical protein